MTTEARARARGVFPQPDIIELVGWPETPCAMTAVSVLRPRRALVLGANMTWPAADSPTAANLCRQLGASLPCPSGITWVVHDSCGVSNLVQMILGRTTLDLPLPSTVHMITRGYKFSLAVMSALKKHLPAGQALPTQLVPCNNIPTLCLPPAPPAASMSLALLQEKTMAQRRLCARLEADCNTLAAALRGEADAEAEARGHGAAARALRNKASRALASAAQAARIKLWVSGGTCVPDSELTAVSEGLAELWTGVQAC